MRNILGIDIGGTKCSVVLGKAQNEELSIISKMRFSTGAGRGPEYTLERIFNGISQVLEKCGMSVSSLDAVGISCGGPLDSKRGIIMSPPNLCGWDNVHIKKIFEDKLGVKTLLQNDANACALAEWKYGAAKGFENAIFMTFGTGLGAGIILNGKLYEGTNGMAGEVGHIRLEDFGPVGYGKSGSFEGFCSGGGIAQLARMKVMEKLQMGEKISLCEDMEGLNKISAKDVGDAADAGDEPAREIYRISGYYLGKGISIIIDILNPEIIVIGGIFAKSGHLLRPAAEEVINRECLALSRKACRIVPAGLGDEIGDYSALAVALND
jgi:glucokinase